MAPKQRMRIANEKATKNITLRGNVPKSSVSLVSLLKFLQIIVTFVITITKSNRMSIIHYRNNNCQIWILRLKKSV